MNQIYASKTDVVEQREIDHAEISRKLAGECMVLLENNGALPFATKKAALFGNGARATVRGGTGSGEVNTRSIVTIEQGLENAGIEITTKSWLDRQEKRIQEDYADYMARVKEKSTEMSVPEMVVMFDYPYSEREPELITEEDIRQSGTDTAVYVIARVSGEGADRYDREGDYRLWKNEVENIRLLAKNYKKTIVVLNIGGVMELAPLKEIEGVDAILLMTQLGNLGGDALADALTGKVNPSGKTTDTWAVRYMDYPSSEKFSHNESVDDEVYEDGIYVGYRYFDTFGVKPLYPFGYGLSYTQFQISEETVQVLEDKVTLSALITNIGDRAGKEVLQVYYSSPDGKMKKPYQELAAYAKTELLAPGEAQKVDVTFYLKAMASYCEACAAWVLEKGDYVISAGNSSASAKAVAVLNLSETVKTAELKNLFAPDMEWNEIEPANAQRKQIPSDIPVIRVDASLIKTEKAQYQGERKEYTTDKSEKITIQDVLLKKASVEELVAQLTVPEMAELCVGTLRAGQGSIVGNASYTVPGAAGDTSPVLKETRGVKNLILADGPAGLRLQPHFKTTKGGKLLPGGDGMSGVFAPFSADLKEEETDDYYQYCTAIPIGWALAQSWNLNLIEKAGDMVGTEMEQFGVDLWLAPALNIHRNPLCGRNFEYYSEDPLVSGKTAAAMTKGVQKHKGKGTTIKHFAVNNQEDNRYFVNAHVHERALREIYLKGFEIAVKEAQPFSIMTSYNLLNGIHTANSHDLIQAAARDEWGFLGTVMTDWFTSQDMPMLTGKFKPKYPISASTGCIFAGNDMQMPGCQKNVDDIVEAVTTGKELDGYRITKADLQYNTANIIRVIVRAAG